MSQPQHHLRSDPSSAVFAFAGSRPGQERSDNLLQLRLCWCPAGKFTMGSPKDEPGRYNEEDQVAVTLTPGFWLGKFEVTQEQWQRLMGTTLHQQRDRQCRDSPDYCYPDDCGEGPDFPMYYVSHTEAERFCAQFTELERQAGRLPAGAEYRLPTEAQWEYGCRAGTTTATAFGNMLSSTQANFDGGFPYNGAAKGPYRRQAVAVGSYLANDWGLCDMHGNVYEWCRDWFQNVLPGGTNPLVLQGSSRVIRGSCWYFSGKRCRSAYRDGNGPNDRDHRVGFRIALVQTGE